MLMVRSQELQVLFLKDSLVYLKHPMQRAQLVRLTTTQKLLSNVHNTFIGQSMSLDYSLLLRLLQMVTGVNLLTHVSLTYFVLLLVLHLILLDAQQLVLTTTQHSTTDLLMVLTMHLQVVSIQFLTLI